MIQQDKMITLTHVFCICIGWMFPPSLCNWIESVLEAAILIRCRNGSTQASQIMPKMLLFMNESCTVCNIHICREKNLMTSLDALFSRLKINAVWNALYPLWCSKIWRTKFIQGGKVSHSVCGLYLNDVIFVHRSLLISPVENCFPILSLCIQCHELDSKALHASESGSFTFSWYASVNNC